MKFIHLFIEIIYLQRISQPFQEISLDLALSHIPPQLHLLDRLRHMPHSQYKYQDQYKTDPALLLYNQLDRHVCPVDCIEEGPDQFYIDPDICIDCGACVAVCPVDAIVEEYDLRPEDEIYLEKAEEFFANR